MCHSLHIVLNNLIFFSTIFNSNQTKTVLWPLDPGPLSLHVSVTVTVTLPRGFNEHRGLVKHFGYFST